MGVRGQEGQKGGGSDLGENGRGSLLRILNPFPPLKVLHGATWFCSSELTVTDLSHPIKQAGALHEVRGQMFPSPKQTSCLLNSCAGYSMGPVGLLHQQWIGLGHKHSYPHNCKWGQGEKRSEKERVACLWPHCKSSQQRQESHWRSADLQLSL